MDEQEGDGTLYGASLVDVMQLKLTKSVHLYDACKHGKSVKLVFMGVPVVTVPPSFDKSLYVCERSTVGPASVINFIWQSSVVKFSFEKGELLL